MTFALRVLLVFTLVAVGDVCWARYTAQISDGNRLKASLWAVAIYLVGSITAVQYIEDHLLILPALAGAFVGTWYGTKKKVG